MSWEDRAACRGLPLDLFFPEGTGTQKESSYEKAKAVCATCTVRAQCLAVTEMFVPTGDRNGVFGGMTPAERRLARYKRDYPNEYRVSAWW